MLDADEEGADWREVARIVLELDPEKAPERVKRVWASHLARAKWMTKHGYRHLLSYPAIAEQGARLLTLGRQQGPPTVRRKETALIVEEECKFASSYQLQRF